MRLAARLFAFGAFILAGLLSVVTANFAATAIEARTGNAIAARLDTAGLDWVAVEADGLLVRLSGTAPNEVLRFRALSVAGTVIDAGRVLDRMDVVPPEQVSAPRFAVELLRNGDGVSLIGLVPKDWDRSTLRDSAAALVGDDGVSDMIETAEFPAPDNWEPAVRFGLAALQMLPRSKVSISAGAVTVTAVSDSPAQKARYMTDLARLAPAGLVTTLDISAPRPVITPFTLRLVIDEAGARFDACSAAADRGRDRILRAAIAAGVPEGATCTLGLGAPSPRWADAAVLGIEALARLGEGTLTMADVDIALIAGSDVPRALFDKVVGDLDAALPDVFSLKASLRERPAEEVATVTVQFTATRSPEGEVQLRGLLADERMRGAVDAFAQARFGAGAVYTATRLDADAVPAGWSVRVLAGLAALSELAQGALLVEPERLEIRGTTGSTGAQAEIARLLSEQLGPGAEFRIDVVYDERLDPVASMPTPDRCVADATAVLAGGKINFAPGSSTLDAEAFRAVERLAEVLRPCIDVPLEIGGHTDSQGGADTNLALSERRAEAVRDGLRQLRIPVGNIVARGYGSAEPVGDNGTEEGREANRRITVRLRLPADGDGTAAAQADETAAADDGGIARGLSPASDADDGGATAAQDADADATNLVADADAGDTETDAAPDDAGWTSAAPQDKTIRPRGRPEER